MIRQLWEELASINWHDVADDALALITVVMFVVMAFLFCVGIAPGSTL